MVRKEVILEKLLRQKKQRMRRPKNGLRRRKQRDAHLRSKILPGGPSLSYAPYSFNAAKEISSVTNIAQPVMTEKVLQGDTRTAPVCGFHRGLSFPAN